MKVIGLMIAKNESWILPTTIPQQLKFVDELLVLDGNSTDNSIQILRNFKGRVHVREQGNNPDNYAAWRQELLTWARQRNATHIVCLDADEMFSADLLKNWRELLSKMKPGNKLMFDWILLWKNARNFVSGGSVFANIRKDFVFCDDKKSPYVKIMLHEGRTPGENNSKILNYVPRETGAVLHFQSVPFERFMMKQAYICCKDYRLNPESAKGMNYKYEMALRTSKIKTSIVPRAWTYGIKISEKLSHLSHDYFYNSILGYFKEKGILYYEPLDIWHIKKLGDYFVKQTGRKPKIQKYNSASKILRRFVGKAIQLLPSGIGGKFYATIKKVSTLLGF